MYGLDLMSVRSWRRALKRDLLLAMKPKPLDLQSLE